MNTLVCGDMARTFDVANERVSSVRRHLREALSIHDEATAFLNGSPVPDDTVIPPGADLEFLRVRGEKGVGQVWTTPAFCAHFDCTPADLEAWLRDGLQVLTAADGTIRITETAVDDFVRGRPAEPPTACDMNPGSVPRPRGATVRSADDQPDLTVAQAMAEVGCSRGMVYKLCKAGQLPHRRVGSQYRISREGVAAYLRLTAVYVRPTTPPSGGYQFRHLG